MRFISNSQLSAVNTLLLNAGNDAVSFEASAVWSRGIVMFIQTWLWFGNTMIMMMSGIMGINPLCSKLLQSMVLPVVRCSAR